MRVTTAHMRQDRIEAFRVLII